MGRHTFLGVNSEAAFNEFTRRRGDAAPVFYWGEGVVCYQDCLHFFEVGVAIEGGVTAKEKVSYYAYGPYVSIRKRASREGGAFS